MVSYELGLRALKRILGKEDVSSFHQVVFFAESEEVEPPLLYLVLAERELLLVDVHTVQSGLAQDNMAYYSEAVEAAKGGARTHRFPTVRLRYAQVEEVVVHAQAEDRFGLVLGEDRPVGLPEVLHLSSCYRKEVVQSLQVLHNTATILRRDNLASLRVRFVGTHGSDARLAFRHPAVKMFQQAPKELLEGGSVFYRRGYMFVAPSHVIDRYELMDFRPCSTYVFRPDAVATKGAAPPRAADPKKTKHMVVRFLPTKPVPVGELDSLLAFHLWAENIAHAVAQKEYEDQLRRQAEASGGGAAAVALAARTMAATGGGGNDGGGRDGGGRDGGGRDGDDDGDDGKGGGAAGAAGAEDFVESYFVVDQAVHRKKLNVVGDQAQWMCYRLHIVTKQREIAVMAVRRKFLPPLLDSYQDMVFVLYGEIHDNGLELEPRFADELGAIVDSLSPTSAALHTRVKKTYEAGADYTQQTLLRTYYDRTVLQARANALFFNRDAYGWLQNRPGVAVIPSTKFIDLECSKLARIFCLSVVKLMKPQELGKRKRGGGGGGGGGDDDGSDSEGGSDNENGGAAAENQADEEDDLERLAADVDVDGDDVTVDNPLSIIFRMQASVRGGDEDDEADEEEARRLLELAGPDAQLRDQLEDWRSRIARYFAYCVDGGVLPDRLTVRRLTLAASQRAPAEDARGTGNAGAQLKRRGSRLSAGSGGADGGEDGEEDSDDDDDDDDEEAANGGGDGADRGNNAGEGGAGGKGAPATFMSRDQLLALDRVIDFLLYFTVSGERNFRHADNVVDKFRECQEGGMAFRPGFSCNEWVMARLLRTGYLEAALERNISQRNEGHRSAQLNESVLTYMYKALLETRSENLELMEAVTSKIASIQLKKPELLLDPLVALVKGGNTMLKTYALRSLTALVPMNLDRKRLGTGANDPVLLCMALINTSKSAPLLQAAMQFLKACYLAYFASGQKSVLTEDTAFVDTMLSFLRPQFGTPFRAHPRMLGDTAMLLLHMSRTEEAVLDHLVRAGVVDVLLDIVRQKEDYVFILAEVTGALTLILTLNSRRSRSSSVSVSSSRRRGAGGPNDAGTEHAFVLAETLGYAANRDLLKVCNNILAALDTMLTFREAEDDADDRFNTLKALSNTDKFDFDSILDDVIRKADDLKAASGDVRDRRTAKIATKLAESFKGLITKGNKSGWNFKKLTKDMDNRRLDARQ